MRAAIGLTQEELASNAETNKVHVGQIELCNRDCTMALYRRLAHELCCEPADLLSVPTPERLSEIRDAFEYRKGQEAAARIAAREAEQQKGVA